jgi:hypothetical protein
MSTPLIFYISEFTTDISANKLLYNSSAIPVITGDIQATINVPIATLKSMFLFKNAAATPATTGATLIINNATRFKFTTPSISIKFGTSLLFTAPTARYANIGDTIGTAYMRYVANCIFSVPSNAELFTDSNTMDDTINTTVQTAINTKLSEISVENGSNGFTISTSTNNPTYKLCRQFGSQINDRFTSELLTNATADFVSVPFVINDVIIFQFILKPDPDQFSVDGSSDNTLVPPVSGIIKIKCVA